MRTKSLMVFLSLFAAKLFAADVTVVSPEGNVKSVQQVLVRFSSDMTALGDPRDIIKPFTPDCKNLKGEAIATPEAQSRWADSRNWSFDYASALSAGVRCEFTMKEGLKDLKGDLVTSRHFSFSTSGPSIIGYNPRYAEIEPEQYIILELDGAIDEESVVKNAYFEVSNMNEKVGINIIKGKERDDILKNEYSDLFKKDPKALSDRFLVISGKKRFPEGATVVLHWTTGVLSKTGLPVTEAQTKSFSVLPPFTMTFSCERTDSNSPCSPVANMILSFNRSVRSQTVKDVVITSGKMKWQAEEITEKYDPEKMVYSLTFKGPFPEKSKFQVIAPTKIKDEAGSELSNAKEYPLTVQTDGYSPLLKFPGRFGVVEWTTQTMLPVSVRNIEKNMKMTQVGYEGKSFNLSALESARAIISLYQRTKDKDEYPSEENDQRNVALLKSEKGAVSFTLPKASGENDFEMMGIPLKNPGFYVVEVESPRLGQVLTTTKAPMFVSTAVLVTNMGIHLKKGIESSLVWVTQLNTAKPVEGANISIRDCGGEEVATGVTDKNGLLKLPVFVSTKKSKCEEWRDYFYVFAKKGIDLSFMRSDWGKGIESWRYQVNSDSLYERKKWGPLVAHTILDRSLFKKGETVQMKHILREHHQNGFSIAGPKVWPKRILVRHSGSGKVYTLPVKIDPKTGSGLNSFPITQEMELGNYEVLFSNKLGKNKKAASEDEGESDDDWDAKVTGSFVVSDFRLPLMSATVKIQGDTLIKTKDIKVDLSAQYLSGGPANKLAIQTRSQLSPSTFHPDFPGAEEYTFFSKPIKEGFSRFEGYSEVKAEDIRLKSLTLDDKGGGVLEINNLLSFDVPKSLIVEMDYADPNGEIKTASGQATIYPSKYIVGLRVDNWFGTADKTKLLGVVTDPYSKLIKKVKYTVEAFKTERYSHRKRLVGGFYAYDSKDETKSLGVVCSGESDDKGRFECEPTKLPPGDISLQAKVVDESKSETYARADINILKDGEDNWWSSGDSDRIDLLPSKKEYDPGETAEFIVKTPFKEASVLVTVEREGILDQFVTTLGRDNPVIKVPLKGVYAPNVVVSAVVVRGRVAEPKPDFLIDLAKPVMKMGLSEIKVGWNAHKLKVDVETNKKKYNVREEATVKIKLQTPSGDPLPKETEVILAAVDESLLLLRKNNSFNLLAGMMTQRPLSVETSSNLNQVIGRRHFGLKAKAPGGGGGAMDARENFDPLLAFIPNLKVNDQGEVEVKIKLNDSISNFRIVAIAHSGANLFGTGQVNIITNKDIILYSGVAPVARSGDKIDNAFTVRNTTDKVMKVQVEAQVKGLENAVAPIPVMELNPSESKVVSIPVVVPDKTKELEFLITAKDTDSSSYDVLKIKETLSPSVPPRVLQATMFQLDKTNTVPVKGPSDAIPGSGNISVTTKSTLVQGLGGVRSYMEDYPYNCLEQRTSKAIALDDKEAIKKIISNLPSFMDDNGLLKFFDWPIICGSSELTRYVLDILDENKIVIPDNTKNKILSGLNDALNGRYACQSWWRDMTKNEYYDQDKVLMLQTLSRYKRFNPKSLESIKITPNLWTTETLTQWIQLLSREKTIPARDEKLKTAQGILRARLNFQGTMMTLQKEIDWQGQWRLFTSNDQEVMGAFNSMMSDNGEDAGKMARGLIARLKRGHWDTTMANAWGVTYMKKFSDKFEKIPVTGLTKIEADEVKSQIDWKKNPQGEKKTLNWPKEAYSKEVNMNFTQEGTGKPWVQVQTSSAIPLKSPMNFGYTIKKVMTPVTQKVKGKWSVGDVVNVDLTVVASSAQSWVVLRDPLPSGASHLGTGLGGESSILDAGAQRNIDAEVSWPLEYEEKSFSYITRYAGFLRSGTYKTSYRYRLNSSGNFKIPPTRVEAMYATEVFGESPNEDVSVMP